MWACTVMGEKKSGPYQNIQRQAHRSKFGPLGGGWEARPLRISADPGIGVRGKCRGKTNEVARAGTHPA